MGVPALRARLLGLGRWSVVTLARRGLRALPRRQQDMLRSGESEVVAEEIVAEALGPNGRHRPDRAEWYDVVLDSTGAKTEVKSTWTEVGDKYPAGGRFRLRRDQTRSLHAANASGVSWYVFVLFDEDSGDLRVRRVRPSTVSRWVRDRGGWNHAGHEEFDYQHKLPYSVVF